MTVRSHPQPSAESHWAIAQLSRYRKYTSLHGVIVSSSSAAATRPRSGLNRWRDPVDSCVVTLLQRRHRASNSGFTHSLIIFITFYVLYKREHRRS